MSKSRDNADNVSGDIGQVTAGTGLSGGGSSGSITLSLDTTSQYVVPTQTGNSGKYLTTNGSTSSWGTVSSYTAPTIGSTTIASGATVTTIAGLTLTSPIISTISNTGTLTLPTSTDTLVGRTTSDTLTNKTISGSNNTLSNIGNASLTNSSITINGSAVSLGGSVSISSLPSQTGNSGKYLTTDGTNASWGVISGALAQPTEPASPPDGQIWVDTDGTSPTAVITRWSKAPSAGTTSITGNDDSSIPLYYTAGYEQVFLNGVLLSRGGDYTATSGTGITLSNATVAGDIVEVISPFQITMADTYTQTQANTTFAADKDQYVLAGQIFG